jgi:chemotaxis protein histidine kinase CheA
MAKDGPQIIDPPNKLKDKVGIGGPNAVDAKTLEQAEQAIVDMTDSYLEWAVEDLAKVGAALDHLLEDPNATDRKQRLEKIFLIVHDMKGQGGSFNYRLITVIGDGLCRAIERMTGENIAAENEVVKVHVDALKLVIGHRMDGDGGKEGEALVAGLRSVAAKVG